MSADDSTVRKLDVREVDQPFGAITEALADLPEDGTLHLINDFEPEPLYSVLEDRGFTYEATEEDGTWRVVIERV